MKKIYALCLAVLGAWSAHAQTTVTFNVDMNGTTVSADGVHIAGNFNDPNYDQSVVNPDYVNWSPSAIALSDDDMDGVYSVTLNLLQERYEFKFINGNDWPFAEDVPSACQVEVNGNDNRELNVGNEGVDYLVCFASCAPCGQKTVRFRVDMTQEEDGVNPIGVHVAGDFQGWNPAGTMLADPDGNGIWEGYYNVGTVSTVEYKFLNGNDWIFAEAVPGDCGVGPNLNRGAELTADNTVLDAVCFGGCSTCVQPTLVTFKVDMSLQTVNDNGPHVAGSFQGWNPGDAATLMTDDDSDGIYEVTVGIQPGSYEYKFVNGDAWDDGNESLPAECNSNGNRALVVGTDAVTQWFCYSQCTQECVSDPDPAAITFRVDMSESTVNAGGVWMISGATTPAWQAGATEMTDVDADGVYECTVTINGPAQFQYKFVNGPVSEPANEENDGLVDCGVANGIGGYNRTHTRSGSPETLEIVCFNDCEACVVSVDELELVSGLRVFPVPAQDFINVSFNNTQSENVTINLVNTLGQVVVRQYVGEVSGLNNIRLDVSGLASGVYMMEITNGVSSQNITVSVK